MQIGSRLARQSFEPLAYFYENWIRSNPDATKPASLIERRRYLIRSIPALLISLALIGVSLLSFATSSGVQKRYRQYLEQSTGALEGLKIDRIGERILGDQVGFSSEDRFELARKLAELDSEKGSAKSDSIVEKLAPDGAQGFALAHRARALAGASVLGRQPIDITALKSLAWHLQQSMGLEDQPLQRLRSQYYVSTGQIEKASKELSRIAESSPEYWFALAEVLLSARDLNAARNALNRAAETYSEFVSKDPADPEARIRYATALARLGEFDGAIESMKTGWKLTNDERFPEGIGEIFLMKFQKQRNVQSPIDQQWEHVQEALAWDPNNRLAYQALSQLCADPDSKRISPSLSEKIEQLLGESKYTSELLFAKSNLMLSLGQGADAERLLTEIVHKYPDCHSALNNLAWLRIDRSDVSSEGLLQAETIARKAVDALPSSSAYRDTLGLVLTKMQRWSEAIAQFEISLRNSQNPIPTLERIAEAYENIGQLELAQQYRSRVEKLRSPAISPGPYQGAGVK
jgi:tetratricopeptide (TPR) repeat protein